jgi:hypothetical protein
VRADAKFPEKFLAGPAGTACVLVFAVFETPVKTGMNAVRGWSCAGPPTVVGGPAHMSSAAVAPMPGAVRRWWTAAATAARGALVQGQIDKLRKCGPRGPQDRVNSAALVSGNV